MNSLSILSVPFIMCFFTIITAAIHHNKYLTGDIYVSCGSAGNFAAVDGQEWIGDMHERIPPYIQIKGSSTSSSIAGGSSTVSFDQAQYKTARISRSQFSYVFHLAPGPKFIRLHFNPGSYRGFEGLKDLFTVQAGPFTLPGNFSASLPADALGRNGKFFAREFCINIEENQRFEMIFCPDQSIQSLDGTYAFINGIEIIAMPNYLSYFHSGGQVLLGLKSLVHIYDYSHTALEVIHRQSMKQSDGSVNMFRPGTTIQKRKIRNNIYIVTWKIDVDVGFRYLVRIHLCELRLRIAKEAHMNFKIFINEIRRDDNIHLVEKRDGNEFLLYRDYMTAIQGCGQDGKHNILVTIESTDELMDRNGPFKGFEILKLISNLSNNLSSPNQQQLARKTMQDLLKVCGDRNIIVMATITIITIIYVVTFKLWQLWDHIFMEKERKLCLHFSLAEIEAATKNFNHKFVIGEGGFGKVYKGIIGNGQETVAIKRLKYSSNQGAREFWTEVETLSELRHVNLVSLIGYCNEQQEMILVYEYMTHGTLRGHLYKKAKGNNRPSFLSWSQCLNICIGAGRGLDHLHTDRKIIHRDVKTSNILLDVNFVAKFSDFGLAKLENICESQSHVSTGVKGTHGYIDPYYRKFRNITSASDVYAFGIVLLEVLCGRPALDPRLEEDGHSLVTWAQENISNGDAEKIVSSNLRGEILPDSLNAFLRVVESCLDEEPKRRPKMTQVVSQLEHALELQEKPYSLEEESTANGSPRDAILTSAKPSNKKEWKGSTSGQNELQRWDNLAEDYFAREVEVRELDGSTIEAATNGFSRSNIIGEGRYGTFYKVVLRTSQVVAVERTERYSFRDRLSVSEIHNLLQNKHPNIMNLLRNCPHKSECILVYEFMENRSTLHAILYGRNQLPWTLCFKIIIGVARGIHYLHQNSILRKIYSNVDPCNIFLDADMNPKIAIDYCGMMIKTSYYAPPEGYHASDIYASDVYGFGVLVLDLLSTRNQSKQHMDLVTFVRGLWKEGRELDLVGTSTGVEFPSEEATRCIEIALSCTQLKPQNRPDISEVLEALERDPELELELRETTIRRNDYGSMSARTDRLRLLTIG